MSQTSYIQDVLAKFDSFLDPTLTRGFDCPMEQGLVLNSDDQPTVGSPKHSRFTTQREAYMSMVGGFLWLANMTMPHSLPLRQDNWRAS